MAAEEGCKDSGHRLTSIHPIGLLQCVAAVLHTHGMTPPLHFLLRLETVANELRAIEDEVLDLDWHLAPAAASGLNDAAVWVERVKGLFG